MAFATFTLPAADRAVSGEQRLVWFRQTFRSLYGPIPAALVASGATAYMGLFEFGLLSGRNRILLRTGTSNTQQSGGPDLTTQFEGNWHIGLAYGGTTWELDHADFATDGTEPYEWRTTDADAIAAMRAARAAIDDNSCLLYTSPSPRDS